MRIAIVVHSMETGGAERFCAHLSNHLEELGHEVYLITFAAVENDFYQISPNVVRISLDLARSSKNFFQSIKDNICRVFALTSIFRSADPHVIIAITTGVSVTSIIASKFSKWRVIVSERTFPPMYPLGRIWEWLRVLTYPWAECVVMQTNDGLTWLGRCIPKARGIVIANPVIYPLPCNQPFVSVADLVSASNRLLLAVGRLDDAKQFDHLLFAFSKLVAKHSDWKLTILGEGPDREKLECIIVQLGLSEKVVMPGRVGNVADWYSRADLYVLSSRFEGFPNTLIEAMAHGCPAVSYDCNTGPRDVIRDGVDGILVRPAGDVSALADALASLMDNEIGRKAMSERATEVRQRFSAERLFALWSALLEKGSVGSAST